MKMVENSSKENLSVNSLTVKDCRFVIELIERLATRGVRGDDLYPLGYIRERMLEAINQAVEADISPSPNPKEEEK